MEQHFKNLFTHSILVYLDVTNDLNKSDSTNVHQQSLSRSFWTLGTNQYLHLKNNFVFPSNSFIPPPQTLIGPFKHLHMWESRREYQPTKYYNHTNSSFRQN